MGISVGIPFLKLHEGKGKGKHGGNAKAVAREAGEERATRDPDIDRARSAENCYYGFSSGEALYDYWRSEADAYRVVDKNGKEKALRSDASIGFALIIKPPAEWIDSLPIDKQHAFMNDSVEIVTDILGKAGLQVDMRARHLDEQGMHEHIMGHDPDYKMGKKANLKLFNKFNQEYPRRMREKGWEVDDLVSYDSEAVKNMTDEERAEYDDAHIKRKKDKKASGKSSAQYKREKDRERQRQLDSQQASIDEQKKGLEVLRKNALDARKAARDEQKKLEEKKKDLHKQEMALKAREDDLQTEKVKLQVELQNAVTAQNRANKARLAWESATTRLNSAPPPPSPVGLEEFAKEFTRKVPKKDIKFDPFTGEVKTVIAKDKAGKLIPVEQNCYDEWRKTVQAQNDKNKRQPTSPNFTPAEQQAIDDFDY